LVPKIFWSKNAFSTILSPLGALLVKSLFYSKNAFPAILSYFTTETEMCILFSLAFSQFHFQADMLFILTHDDESHACDAVSFPDIMQNIRTLIQDILIY
jgi:hypothetical protein